MHVEGEAHMSEERLRFLGRLEESRMESERLRVEIEALRDGLRLLLDPFVEIERIDGEKAAFQAVRLASCLVRRRKVLDRMGLIRRELGEDPDA
jgi:hypothetical protein